MNEETRDEARAAEPTDADETMAEGDEGSAADVPASRSAREP